MTINTLLCFDYGEKRIGVAVGQTVTGTATPLSILTTVKNDPDWAGITRLIQDWQPDALIVGHPLNMDGTEQSMTEQAASFARRLEGRYKLPVFAMDERLSTFEARERSGQDAWLDSIAAQAILETWLAEHAATETQDYSVNP